jgi:hypothetical protein
MNSIRRTVGAKTVDIAAPVVNWARKSGALADDLRSGVLCHRDDRDGRGTIRHRSFRRRRLRPESSVRAI